MVVVNEQCSFQYTNEDAIVIYASFSPANHSRLVSSHSAATFSKEHKTMEMVLITQELSNYSKRQTL